MAVPKKKKSKSKTSIRKNAWKKSISKKTIKALSLGKSIINGKNTKFIIIGKNV